MIARDGEVHTSESAQNTPVFSLALLGAAFTFCVCYFREFVFPHTAFLPWRDAVGFLNNGTRIAAGRLPYRDYFAFVPPGTELTYALLIREFGARAWIPSLMMACLAAVALYLKLKISEMALVYCP